MALLDHRSPEMTIRYARLAPPTLRAAYDQAIGRVRQLLPIAPPPGLAPVPDRVQWLIERDAEAWVGPLVPGSALPGKLGGAVLCRRAHFCRSLGVLRMQKRARPRATSTCRVYTRRQCSASRRLLDHPALRSGNQHRASIRSSPAAACHALALPPSSRSCGT